MSGASAQLPPRRTVFVVDDDSGLLRLIKKALEREGFLTAVAGSFEQAVEWLSQHQPDLMLLDLQLGEITGKDLIDHLASHGRSVPFIIITGQGDERVAVAMMKRGAIDYLIKDVDFLQFVPEVVRRALSQLERDKKLLVAEEALRRSEANLAKAQQIAHLGSYELNVPSSSHDYRSDEIYRILGLQPPPGGASSQDAVERMVHPADQAMYRATLARAIGEAASFNFEYRVVRPDGSVRYVQSIGQPVLDTGGQVKKLVGTLLDITERKRAEHALRREHAFTSAVLDTSAALVVVLDKQGQVVRFNRACEQTTGYPQTEVAGKCFWDLLLPAEEVGSARAVFEGILTGQSPTRSESHCLTRAGGRRLVAWSHSALVDEQGQVEYVISVGIDITERRRLEQEILQISELEQRRIGQDLHDGLCQHLAATALMGEILEQKIARKSKADGARVAEIAKQVRECIGHTRALARGLSPVVVESQGLMSALEELAGYTARMFHIQCLFQCETPVLIDDHGLATHLYRIAQEGISNGIRHGKAKRLTITLRQETDRIVLRIHDDGIGLPDDLSAAKGMGLRIMRYRAAMIAGILSVRRDPEGGTSVICSIEH